MSYAKIIEHADYKVKWQSDMRKKEIYEFHNSDLLKSFLPEK